MDFGVLGYVTDRGIGVTKLALEVEGHGIDMLLVPDHSHIPVEDAEAPDYAMNTAVYARLMDPFVALASAAAVTTRLKIATGIVLAAQREPIALAKAASSLDVVSGGRFTLGVGHGWHETELRHHGVEPRSRFAVVSEHVRAMREIWTKEAAEFHGRFVSFGPIMSWPKPVRGSIPVMAAGYGPRAVDRAFEWADGWYPSGAGGADSLRAYAPRFEEFRARAHAEGRPEMKLWLLSEHHEDDHVEAMLELGVDQAVFAIAPGDEAETLTRLEEIAKAISRHT